MRGLEELSEPLFQLSIFLGFVNSFVFNNYSRKHSYKWYLSGSSKSALSSVIRQTYFRSIDK